MSASSKKKLRKEQNAAHMTKKQQAAKKEARKLLAYTVTFWVILALCVSLVLGMSLKNPVNNTIDRLTTAVKVGSHDVTATELTYFFIDGINNWYSQYGSYAQYLNLDTSVALDKQEYDKDTGTTWADYFLDEAIESAKNVYALCDAAEKAGYKLSAEEKADVDALYENLETQAKTSKVSVSKYLQSIYGGSASEKSYKEYYEITVLASSYYSHYSEELKGTYTDAGLREFEKDAPYEYNSYTYASHYLSLDTFKLGGTKDDKGNVTYSDEELAAAKEYLEQFKADLTAEGIDTIEELNAAIAKMEDDFAAIKAEKDKTTSEDKKDEATTEKTEDEATTEKTEDEATTEKTEDEATTEKTEDEATTEKPEDEATTEKTEDEATTEKPEDEATTEKPEDEATTEKPEDGATTEDKKEESSDDEKEEEDKHTKATENKEQLYSKISSVMQEWIRDSARKTGDITALAYESGEDDAKELKGYYIVLFQECHDNVFPLVNVRHLLVAFEGGTEDSTTGQTTYSAEEKAAAKKEAEKLLQEWKDGAATEDSFAELANKHSDDGDGTTGGLYEDVYPGQMVTNFNDWCFDDERKAGDTGIVETEYGYHVMFYSSDSEENYRDYMVTNDKLTEEMNAWQDGLLEAMTVVEKNLKRIDTDLILNSGSSTTTDDHEGHNH